MSNYSKVTDFAAKDGLSSGNSLKVVRGTEIDVELELIETAVNSKTDGANATLTGTTAITTLALSGEMTSGTIDGGTY